MYLSRGSDKMPPFRGALLLLHENYYLLFAGVIEDVLRIEHLLDGALEHLGKG